MPYVWEPAPYLRELIAKAPNKQQALRLQLLYLLATQQATSRTSVAALLGLDRDTIASWLSKYEQGGLAALLDRAQPPGLPSSLPAEVVEAMRLKLQEPVGLASFKALQAWVEQAFQLHTTYRIIHYTASQVLGARLAVGRRSHVKKKPGMRRPFAPAFKLAYTWL
jgi:transposase